MRRHTNTHSELLEGGDDESHERGDDGGPLAGCRCRKPAHPAATLRFIIGSGILIAINAIFAALYVAPSWVLGRGLHTAKVELHTVIAAQFVSADVDLRRRVDSISCWAGRLPSTSDRCAWPPGVNSLEGAQQHALSWLTRDLDSFAAGWRGRGIVMTISDETSDAAVTLLRSLHEVHGNTLPIDIFYVGEESLSIEQQQRISRIAGVTRITDLRREMSLAEWHAIRDHAKPFAAFFSSFAEIILLEPSTVLLHAPGAFFDHPGYIGSRSLFFRDRCTAGAGGAARNSPVSRAAAALGVPLQIGGGAGTAGADAATALPAEFSPSSPSVLAQASNGCLDVQDAGVVVLDKRKPTLPRSPLLPGSSSPQKQHLRDAAVKCSPPGACTPNGHFYSLVATCMLNDFESRQVTRGSVGLEGLSEKETWWLGARAMGAAVYFNNDPPGVVGERRGSAVCASAASHVLHTINATRPSWWRGGLSADALPVGYNSGTPGVFSSWATAARESPPIVGSPEAAAAALCVPLRAGSGARDSDFTGGEASIVARLLKIYGEEEAL